MASQRGQATDAVRRHRDEAAPVLGLLGELRDDLHRLTAEIAEGVATSEQHHEMVGRLQRLAALLSIRGQRLAVRRYGAAEL